MPLCVLSRQTRQAGLWASQSQHQAGMLRGAKIRHGTDPKHAQALALVLLSGAGQTRRTVLAAA